jgi:serine/threonine protein kinase
MISVTIHDKAAEALGTSADRLEPLFRSCIQAHEGILAEGRGSIRKNSPESAVTLVDVPGWPRVCVKELRWRGWAHALKGILRPPHGLRTYRNGWKLIEAGVSAAAPLALVRRSCFRVVQSEWIIMEVIPQALELDRYVLRQASRPWPRDERRAFALAFGRFIGGLHARGIVHSDLKTCNILVSPGPKSGPSSSYHFPSEREGFLPHPVPFSSRERQMGNEGSPVEMAPFTPSPPAGEGRVRGTSSAGDHLIGSALISAEPRFSLLDYDDVGFFHAVPMKKRIKNLVQIFLSSPLVFGATDRLRFVQAYAEETGLSRNEARELAAAVLGAARGRTILYVGFDGDVVEEWE